MSNGATTYLALCASNTPPDAYLRALSDTSLAALSLHLEETNAKGGIPAMVQGQVLVECADRFVRMSIPAAAAAAVKGGGQ